MANNGYDEPRTRGQGTSSSGTGSSSSPSRFNSNSTGGGSSFSQGDNLDPVRRGEGGLWKPQGDNTGTPEGGATDKAGNSEGGATDSTGSAGGGATDTTNSATDSAVSSNTQGDNLANEEDFGSSSGHSTGKSNTTSRFKARFKMSPRQAAIGTGAITGFAGLGIAGFLLLIPLKIEHVVKNLENRFFATSQNAVQSETDTMFKRYIVKRVLPNLKGNCGSTIHKNCASRKATATGNPVTQLYNTWSEAKIENKMADKFGIELQRRPDGVYLKRSPKDPGLNIGQNGERIDGVFEKSTGSEIHNAIQEETSWYNVMMRYKFGRLAESKYGVKRCIIYCGASDPLHDKIAEQKIAAKLYMTQRVIIPHTQSLGIALECLFTGCDPTATDPNGDPGDPASHGAAADSEVDKPVSDGLRKLALSYGIVDEAALKALQNTVDTIGKDGIQHWLLKEGLMKAGATPAVAAITSDAIPIVGQVNMAANIVRAADNVGPTLKKLRYVVNGAAYAQTFMLFRTYADELHTGHVTPTEVGSLVKSLGSDASTAKDKVGGSASAESTPLYRHLIDGESKPSVSAGTAANYTCQNGKTVPAGKQICDEESLGGGNGIANAIHDFLHLPGVDVLTTIANIWHDTVGQVYNFVGGVFGDILSGAMTVLAAPFDLYCNVTGALPIIGGVLQHASPYCTAKDLASKALPIIIKGIMEYLIPNPLSTEQSGGRTFDAMAGGADVAGNDFAHNGIGGKALTTTQAAAIVNTQESEAEKQFSQQPFFARMFNTDSDYSLITKVAMDVPFNFQTAFTTSFADLLSNPFGALTHSFGSIFSKRVFAVTDAGPDAFTVTQYGYTPDDLAKIGDPEAYWDANCTDDATQGYQKDNTYNKAASGSANIDPETAMPQNTNTNPCELIKATTGSAGGKDDTSNLEQDDLADVNGSSGSSTPPAAAPGTVVFPFRKGIAVAPSSWTQDQGVDISTNGSACGTGAPELAMGNGIIVSKGISGFGPDAPVLRITDTTGPLAGRYIYYGHAGDRSSSNGAGLPANSDVGAHVTAGQVITYTGCGVVGLSTGPHLEIGLWPKGSSPSTTFPSNHQTSAEMLQILTDAYKAQGG